MGRKLQKSRVRNFHPTIIHLLETYYTDLGC